MVISEIFPGCESFPEDTQPEPSEAENREMILEMTEEFYRAEMDSVNTEKLLSHLDDLTLMFDHVQTFGVDRSFLSLTNRDNRLGRYLQLQIPSCESFDIVGDPNSHISIVAMEGLWDGIKKIAAKIRDIIKGIAHWIATKFKKFINWIKSWFNSSSSKISKYAKVGQRIFSADELEELFRSEQESGKFILKTIGKHALDDVGPIIKKLKEATAIMSQEYKNDDPTKFKETVEDLRIFMTKKAKVVSADRIVINFYKSPPEITGKNVDYECEKWHNLLFNLPNDELIDAVVGAATILEEAIKHTDGLLSKISANVEKTDGKEQDQSKSSSVKILTERSKSISKLYNSIALASGKIMKTYAKAINGAIDFYEFLNATMKAKLGGSDVKIVEL